MDRTFCPHWCRERRYGGILTDPCIGNILNSRESTICVFVPCIFFFNDYLFCTIHNKAWHCPLDQLQSWSAWTESIHRPFLSGVRRLVHHPDSLMWPGLIYNTVAFSSCNVISQSCSIIVSLKMWISMLGWRMIYFFEPSSLWGYLDEVGTWRC